MPVFLYRNKIVKNMKTKTTVMTVAAIVLTAFTLAANPVSKIAVINLQKSSTYKVIYEGATAGKVTLKLYDNSSKEIFSETINGLSKFMRPLNFEGMETGVYTIEITDENGAQIQKVNYDADSNSTKTTESSIKALHVSKLEEGKYLMSVANSGSETINIRIFDNNNNLVHDEFRSINNGLGIVYNLKEVKGSPVFMVTDNTGKSVVIK
jgi:hypothetical protein